MIVNDGCQSVKNDFFKCFTYDGDDADGSVVRRVSAVFVRFGYHFYNCCLPYVRPVMKSNARVEDECEMSNGVVGQSA